MMQKIHNLVIGFVVVLSVVLLAQVSVQGQSRKARREANAEESAKPKKVSGGETFQTSNPYDKAYDLTLNFFKKQDYTMDSASREIGQIITAMSIEGGYRQTGTRVQITLIKESETSTTVRVAVAKQKRYKALQVEPWGDPKVDAKESAKLADDLKTTLKAAELAK
ncbi:MAG: hypothetical protein HYR55_04960 [Acidobacteria bacterium]|nr:hypothetical protein [Acidobacteriota bacterium]